MTVKPTLNILMLGGAKRVSIGEMLLHAARVGGFKPCLFSYELATDVPIAKIARVIMGKRWSDAGIVDDIVAVCTEYEIDILLPFVDGAIEIAAVVSRRLPRVFAPVSEPEVCRRMFDKRLADAAFAAIGMPKPLSFSTSEEFIYPVIAKPARGSASRGIVVLHSAADLPLLSPSEEYLFQEYIADREEYTVDCYVDRLGEIVAAVPRRRIEVLGGEVMRTATVESTDIVELSRKILSGLRLRGAVTIQFLRCKTSGRLMVMEVNPRLGGGVVCSVHAGVDFPTYIINDSQGFKNPAADYRPGVEIARYMQEVAFVNNSIIKDYGAY